METIKKILLFLLSKIGSANLTRWTSQFQLHLAQKIAFSL